MGQILRYWLGEWNGRSDGLVVNTTSQMLETFTYEPQCIGMQPLALDHYLARRFHRNRILHILLLVIQLKFVFLPRDAMQ